MTEDLTCSFSHCSIPLFSYVCPSAALTGLTNNTCTATGHQECVGACPVMDATVNAEQGVCQEINSTHSRDKPSTGIGVSGQQTVKEPEEPLLGCTRVNPNCAACGSLHKSMQAGIVTLVIGQHISLILAGALLPCRMTAASSS